MFEVVPANQVNEIMEEIRQVSDEWLKEKDNAEKRFSVADFPMFTSVSLTARSFGGRAG